ncbi:MAG: adenosylmethionine--8-amino-7-oxononanoate transaminase [Actinomycetes bacterium]
MALEDSIAFDQEHIWHPYAPSPSQSPMYLVERASGVRITLNDGRELIDGMASWWSAIHGYNHPMLNAAVTDQLSNMSHMMFGGLTHPAAVGLARRLIDLAPDGITRVFFSDSGSVAVEIAIKMAVQYWLGVGKPERHRLLTVRGGYHGDTFAAMSVCDPVNGMHHQFEQVLTKQLFAPRPAPVYGDAFASDHISEIRQLLSNHEKEIAALILEPIVQGAGGMHFYSPDYLAAIRTLCDDHDILLIADEIATGFGRTGKMFACEHASISPDILCVGKALTGGYLSMAATLCTDRVASAVSAAESGALMHGPTFMGNPLAASVASASIDLLVGQLWSDRIREIEVGLTGGLEPARDLPGVEDVRVLGAIGVIEMKHPLPPSAQAFLVDQGVWLRPFGRLLYTLPPYVTDQDDLARVTQAMVATAANF